MARQQGRRFFFTTYRLQTRPDDEIEVFDKLPAMPRRDNTMWRDKVKHDYSRRIAWCMDYRGDNDDEPTLMFVGAGYSLIKKVCRQLFPKSHSWFTGLTVYRVFYPFQRQGKAWVWVAVGFKGLREDLISLRNIGTIIQNKIKREYACKIRYNKLETFINL